MQQTFVVWMQRRGGDAWHKAGHDDPVRGSGLTTELLSPDSRALAGRRQRVPERCRSAEIIVDALAGRDIDHGVVYDGLYRGPAV
jgi:hypothetical protein